MDENTWRFAQLMMWIIGLQTTVLLVAIGFVWNNLSKRMDNFETSMSKIDGKIIELDKRLFG